MFTFNWNYGDVLRIIPDDLYDFCYNGAKYSLVFVSNSLYEGNKSIRIRSNLTKFDYRYGESYLIKKMKNIRKDFPMMG